MGLFFKNFKGKGTFPRGVHPPGNKNLSANVQVDILPTPEKIIMPLLQNIGAPCKPVVKAKQQVVLGELIAESDAYISAKIHSPISSQSWKNQKSHKTLFPKQRWSSKRQKASTSS